jgi:aminotransferase
MNFTQRFIPAFRRDFKARDSGSFDRPRYLKIASELKDLASLNSGDPDLTAAPAAVEAAVDALRTGKTHYVYRGLPELLEALGRKLATENHVTVDARTQIIVTNGSAEAATAVFQTLLEPGDEILTTDPYYSGHVGSILTARGVPVLVPTSGDTLWEPDPAEVEARITPRTKGFIFANPGNPSAAVYRRETLQALLDLAHRRNILMIPDELFERYVYDGHRHISMASLPGAADRVITLGGFSKSYCMTGWRLGWIAAPSWLAGILEQVRYAMSMAAGTPNQWGAVAALSEAAAPYYAQVYRTYGERRAFFLQALAAAGLPQRATPGGFVGMLDIRRTGRPSGEVAEIFLREGRVAMWPATAFGPHGEGWLRYGLVVPLDTLKEGMARLAPVIRTLLRSDVTRV